MCPQTRLPLQLINDALQAANGQTVYPLRAGIPQFLRYSAAETAEGESSLRQLNNRAREVGWLSALQEQNQNDPGFISYVTDPKRALFVSILPLTRESRVLEIGTGLGQFTTVLARQARSVCGLEVVAGQAEFTAERCRQEGLTNVQMAVGGDDCRLPYADSSFDLVVLNLVFEWCAARCVDESHLNVQKRLLAEMRRVLKPGGALYLATKNRFALKYVLGKTDEHYCNMPFGSALPRGIANLLLRRRGHARSPGQLYSHDALKTMLHDAGFENCISYWATPEMRFPAHYIPTDVDSVRKARRDPQLVQGEMRSTRLLMRWIPAALVKYFTPGLSFLAIKRR